MCRTPGSGWVRRVASPPVLGTDRIAVEVVEGDVDDGGPVRRPARPGRAGGTLPNDGRPGYRQRGQVAAVGTHREQLLAAFGVLIDRPAVEHDGLPVGRPVGVSEDLARRCQAA